MMIDDFQFVVLAVHMFISLELLSFVYCCAHIFSPHKNSPDRSAGYLQREVLCADEVFSQTLMAMPDGEQWVHTRGVGSKNLDLERSKHKTGTVTMGGAGTSAKITLHISVFRRRRRDKGLVYWSLSDLYTLFGVTGYKFPSNWIAQIKTRYTTAWSKNVGCDASDAYVCSINGGDNEGLKKNQQSWPSRCLEHPSLSTSILLFVALRGAHKGQKKFGGFSTQVSRDNSEFIATSLLAILRTDDVRIRITITKRFATVWPCPRSKYEPRFFISVDTVGVAHFDELVAFASGPQRTAVAATWWSAISIGMVSADPAIPLAELLLKFTNNVVLQPLVTQLLLELGPRIDFSIGQRVVGKTSAHPASFSVSWDGLDAITTANGIDKANARYLNAVRRELANDIQFFIFINKGHPGILPLQNSILTVPRNFGALLPPYVRWGMGQAASLCFFVFPWAHHSYPPPTHHAYPAGGMTTAGRTVARLYGRMDGRTDGRTGGREANKVFLSRLESEANNKAFLF